MIQCRSESITSLAKAMVACQPMIDNATKNSMNPAFRSKYANLEAVIDCFKEEAGTCGLVLLQSPGMIGDRASLTSLLLHESGEFIEFLHECPLPKSDPQGFGSAMTYLRRYSAAAIWNLTQEDDDASKASGPASKTPPAQPSKASQTTAPAVTTPAKEAEPCTDTEKKIQIYSDLVKTVAKGRAFVQNIEDEKALEELKKEIEITFTEGKGTVDRLDKITAWLKKQK